MIDGVEQIADAAQGPRPVVGHDHRQLIGEQVDSRAVSDQTRSGDHVHLRFVRADEEIDGSSAHDLARQHVRCGKVETDLPRLPVFAGRGGERVRQAHGGSNRDRRRMIMRPRRHGPEADHDQEREDTRHLLFYLGRGIRNGGSGMRSPGTRPSYRIPRVPDPASRPPQYDSRFKTVSDSFSDRFSRLQIVSASRPNGEEGRPTRAGRSVDRQPAGYGLPRPRPGDPSTRWCRESPSTVSPHLASGSANS